MIGRLAPAILKAAALATLLRACAPAGTRGNLASAALSELDGTTLAQEGHEGPPAEEMPSKELAAALIKRRRRVGNGRRRKGKNSTRSGNVHLNKTLDTRKVDPGDRSLSGSCRGLRGSQGTLLDTPRQGQTPARFHGVWLPLHDGPNADFEWLGASPWSKSRCHLSQGPLTGTQ